MNRARRIVAGLAVVLGVTSFAASARAYDPITWRSFDGGGIAFANAGGYRLGATIGQPDAGSLAAGALTLRGGFWTGGQAGPLGVDGTSPVARVFHFFPTSPNPVRSRSCVAFDLPRASRVGLAIFDVSGRAVNRWDFGRLAAGRQERTWAAVDQGGRALPGGVYFLRLDTDRDQAVHKVVVLH